MTLLRGKAIPLNQQVIAAACELSDEQGSGAICLTRRNISPIFPKERHLGPWDGCSTAVRDLYLEGIALGFCSHSVAEAHR